MARTVETVDPVGRIEVKVPGSKFQVDAKGARRGGFPPYSSNT